jgi:hypothetical protein
MKSHEIIAAISMISVRSIVRRAKPKKGIGYRITRGGAVGNLPVKLTIIVEQIPRKKQATSRRQQCRPQSLSHPE